MLPRRIGSSAIFKDQNKSTPNMKFHRILTRSIAALLVTPSLFAVTDTWDHHDRLDSYSRLAAVAQTIQPQSTTLAPA